MILVLNSALEFDRGEHSHAPWYALCDSPLR